jgi:hypothetical protein
MISNFVGAAQEVDFTGRKNASVTYDAAGSWSIVA